MGAPKGHRAGLAPKDATRRDKLLGAGVAGVMVAELAETLEVVLDTTWDHVQVEPAAGDLAKCSRHLREQTERDKSRSDRDQEAYPSASRGQRGGHGPGLGQRAVLGEESVGEASGDEEGPKSAILRSLNHLPQVLEGRRALGSQRTGVGPVPIDWDETSRKLARA